MVGPLSCKNNLAVYCSVRLIYEMRCSFQYVYSSCLFCTHSFIISCWRDRRVILVTLIHVSYFLVLLWERMSLIAYQIFCLEAVNISGSFVLVCNWRIWSSFCKVERTVEMLDFHGKIIGILCCRSPSNFLSLWMMIYTVLISHYLLESCHVAHILCWVGRSCDKVW